MQNFTQLFKQLYFLYFETIKAVESYGFRFTIINVNIEGFKYFHDFSCS